MGKKRANVLNRLDETLEELRDNQIRPDGMPDGLGGHNLDNRVPEIEDEYRVSNTHPFREVDEDDEESSER